MYEASDKKIKEDDDKENLNLLLCHLVNSRNRNEHSTSLTDARLTALSSRLEADATASLNFWKRLKEETQLAGFQLLETTHEKKSTNNNVSEELPSAFKTETGKEYLLSVSSLLNLSYTSVAKNTLNALSSLGYSIDKEESKISLLLGTSTCLELTLRYSFEQRRARLRFITEALRLENEGYECTQKFLDGLDSLTIFESHNEKDSKHGSIKKRRGLFRILLCLACTPISPLSREGLLRLLSLKNEKYSNRNTSNYSDTDFNISCIEILRKKYDISLRTEALEALLILLYDRIDSGVDRTDYSLLIHGLNIQSFFVKKEEILNHNMIENRVFSTSFEWKKLIFDEIQIDVGRRSKLTSLILSEAVSLWRVTNSSSSLSYKVDLSNDKEKNNPLCSLMHPFFRGEREKILAELNFLGNDTLLNKFSGRLDLSSPISVALFTFGLLLVLFTKIPYKMSLLLSCYKDIMIFCKDLGEKCVSLANEEYGVFSYLHEVMASILPLSYRNNVTNYKLSNEIKSIAWFQPKSRLMELISKQELDSLKIILWEKVLIDESMKATDVDREQIVVTNNDENRAAIMVYANIYREVLIGTISAFHSTILVHTDDNVNMLCSLSAHVYRNNCTLCHQFWKDWDIYCHRMIIISQNNTPVDPLCFLLDAARKLASADLRKLLNFVVEIENDSLVTRDENNNICSVYDILPSIIPLLRLVSSILPSGNSFLLHLVIERVIPEGMLHLCLVGVAQLCQSHNIEGIIQDDVSAESKSRSQLIETAVDTMHSMLTLVRLFVKNSNVREIDSNGGFAKLSLWVTLEPKQFRSYVSHFNNVDNINSANFISPKLLYLIAKSATSNKINSSYKRQYELLSSYALLVLSELICSLSDTHSISCGLLLERCIAQGDLKSDENMGFTAFVTIHKSDWSTDQQPMVMGSAMILLEEMSYNLMRLAFHRNVDSKTLHRYINTLNDGSMVAITIITASLDENHSRNEANLIEQLHIVKVALSALHVLLKALSCIAINHSISYVKDLSKTISFQIVKNFSNATKFGNILAFYAIWPVVLDLSYTKLLMHLDTELLHTVTNSSSLYKEVIRDTTSILNRSKASIGKRQCILEDSKIIRNNYLFEKIKINHFSRELVFDYDCTFHDNLSFPILSRILDVTQTSLSLLKLWGDISEEIALDGYEKPIMTVLKGSFTMLNDLETLLSPNQKIQIGKDLQSLSPSKFLLGNFLPHAISVIENIEERDLSFLSLISRYIQYRHTKINMTNQSNMDSLVCKAVYITDLCFKHFYFTRYMSNDYSRFKLPSNILQVARTVIIVTDINTVILDLLRDFSKFSKLSAKNYGKITFMLELFKLLNFMIRYIPEVAKQVFFGENKGNKINESCEIVDLMMKKFYTMNSSSSIFDCLVVSSYSNILYHLYESMGGEGSKVLINIQSCHEIKFSFFSKQKIISFSTSIVMKLIEIISNLTNGDKVIEINDEILRIDMITLYKKGALLNVISRLLLLLSTDLLLFIKNKGKSLSRTEQYPANMLDDLKKLSEKKSMILFYKTIKTNNNLLIASKCEKAIVEFSRNSVGLTKFAPAIIDTKLLTDYFIHDDIKLFQLLISCHSLNTCSQSQADVITSWSMFLRFLTFINCEEIFSHSSLILSDLAGTHKESHHSNVSLNSLSHIDTRGVLSMTGLTLGALAKFAESISLVTPVSSNFNKTSKYIQNATAAFYLANNLFVDVQYFFHSDKQINSVLRDHGEGVIHLLEELLESSEKYFEATKPSFLISSVSLIHIGCQLRMQMLSCALLFVTTLTKEQKLMENVRNDLHFVRVGFCRLASNAIGSLKHMSYVLNQRDRNIYYQYCFESLPENKLTPVSDCSLDLLRISISLLSSLLSSFNCSSLISDAHQYDIFMTLESCLTIPNLWDHMEVSTSVKLHSVSKHAYENAIDIFSRIIDVANSIASSSIILSSVLVKHNYFNLLMNSHILHRSCEKWLSMSAGENMINGSYLMRGYIQSTDDLLFSGKKYLLSKDSNITIDPVHEVWCACIQSVTFLLRSYRVSYSNKMGNMIMWESKNDEILCFRGAIDFLSTYKDAMLSCLELCSYERKTNNFSVSKNEYLTRFLSLTQHASTPPLFSFTKCILKEAREVLILLSELCSGYCKKMFESCSVCLYEKCFLATLEITKSLSSFLGSLGAARDILSTLSTLHGVIGKNDSISVSTDKIMDLSLASHPLLAHGILNAKHEAIWNAYYTSCCCICMTSQEYTLSLSESKHGLDVTLVNGDSSVSLVKNVQKLIHNDFILTLELIAGQSIFSALNFIEKNHPSSSAFKLLTEDEARNINFLPQLLDIGSVVAIRQKQSNVGKCYFGIGQRKHSNRSYFGPPVKYAHILSCCSKSKTLNVRYIDKSKPHNVEMNVVYSRLAGIEDKSKRRCIFEYLPAPWLVTERSSSFTSPYISIGHLILILSWCNQFLNKDTGQKRLFLPRNIVKGIAQNTFTILATEISNRNFNRAPESYDSQKDISEQLLTLLGKNSIGRKIDPNAVIRSKPSYREGIDIGDEYLWKIIIQQLEIILNEQNIEGKVIKKSHEKKM